MPLVRPTVLSLVSSPSAVGMSRSNWRARKANVGSGRDEHHHCRDTPPNSYFMIGSPWRAASRRTERPEAPAACPACSSPRVRDREDASCMHRARTRDACQVIVFVSSSVRRPTFCTMLFFYHRRSRATRDAHASHAANTNTLAATRRQKRTQNRMGAKAAYRTVYLQYTGTGVL